MTEDFPGGPAPKTPCSQSMGPGFDLWLGNWTPRAATKSLHATTKTQCSQINKRFFLIKKNCIIPKVANNNSLTLLNGQSTFTFPQLFYKCSFTFFFGIIIQIRSTYCIGQMCLFKIVNLLGDS